ncbi:MAG: 5-formyltetrahydrofolate cyclo-ligase [Rhodospirillales bacterium]|jgi:5-formyltetrahydrofolate cyclo-ligase|nr:5-formyltetrahydrofolate cyclo-ligase [Rhodospirillales bacterium]MDP6774835.1 5-formyltetrahydrofolate cyclo-ligase [Rhodospirillales bacterium]
MSVIEDKRRLRAEAAAVRRGAQESAAAAARRLQLAFTDAMGAMGVPAPGAVVSAYWPMGDELDVRPLLHHLHGAGHVCALPTVVRRGEALVFRVWHPGMDLDKGVLGTRHPPAAAAAVRPEVVLAPLLAFDAEGYRLGYGGGYYDRTLAGLRGDGPALAIGIAYAAQQVDKVPRTGYDEPLDWIVTEEGAIKAR